MLAGAAQRLVDVAEDGVVADLVEEMRAAEGDHRLRVDVGEEDERPVPAAAPAAQVTLAAAQRSAAAAAHEQSAEASRTEVAARETLPLIRQQLDALDSRQITWLGDVWPGQAMRWEIAEDDPSRHEHDEASDWRTRFALDLPALGEVGAELGLSGAGVRITLRARNADVAQAMQAAAGELVRALQQAGIVTTGLEVRCGEPSD